jgi:hypothetical protein
MLLKTRRRTSLTEATLASDQSITTVGAAGERLSSRIHRFSRLDVGAVIVRNPELVVADVRLRDADMLLGIDFLEKRRLWLSYGATRIYLSNR